MTSVENYWLQFRKWECELRAGGTENYAKYVTKQGKELWVRRRPETLTAKQRIAEFRLQAKRNGFDPPDD